MYLTIIRYHVSFYHDMFRIVRVLIIFTACLLGVGAVPVLQAQGLSGYVHTVPDRFFLRFT